MNASLREQLQRVTEVEDISRHGALLDDLNAHFCHSISEVESELPLEQFTCAVYAFDLVNNPTYVDIATFGLGSTFAGRDFVEFALQNDLLYISKEFKSESNTLAIYTDDQKFQHIGKLLTDSRVISKWGTGLLLNHEIWEVPAGYGDQVHYYSLPIDVRGIDIFRVYATSRGFS